MGYHHTVKCIDIIAFSHFRVSYERFQGFVFFDISPYRYNSVLLANAWPGPKGEGLWLKFTV